MTILKWYNNPKEEIDTCDLHHLWAETQLTRLNVVVCMVCLGLHSYNEALGYLEYLINTSDTYLEDNEFLKRIRSTLSPALEELVTNNILAIEDMALQLNISYAKSMWVVIHYIHTLIMGSMPTIVSKLDINLTREKTYKAIGTTIIKRYLLSVEDIVNYFTEEGNNK